MARGLDLKVKRVRAEATQQEVADKMGVSTTRVSVIENSPRVGKDTVARYLAALEVLNQERQGKQTTVRIRPAGWGIESMLPAEQYAQAKARARQVAREQPWVRIAEVEVLRTTPAALLLGILDGLDAVMVPCTLVDGGGTIINRRVG